LSNFLIDEIKMKFQKSILCKAVIASLAWTCVIQLAKAEEPTHPTDSIRADLSVPDSPVSALLGDAAKAVDVSTPRELGLGLIRGVDGTGKLKDGLHFEFSPYKLFGYQFEQKKDANDVPVYDPFASIRVGLASANGAGFTSDGQRIATGIHMNIIDYGTTESDASRNQTCPTICHTRIS
jgi:hypothetical protein